MPYVAVTFKMNLTDRRTFSKKFALKFKSEFASGKEHHYSGQKEVAEVPNVVLH